LRIKEQETRLTLQEHDGDGDGDDDDDDDVISYGCKSTTNSENAIITSWR